MNFLEKHRDRPLLPKVVQEVGLFRCTGSGLFLTSKSFSDRWLELAPILDQVGAVQDMETIACREEPWWTTPENVYLPLVFYMEEEQEKCIFGG